VAQGRVGDGEGLNSGTDFVDAHEVGSGESGGDAGGESGGIAVG
jgi:hypothetical protein